MADDASRAIVDNAVAGASVGFGLAGKQYDKNLDDNLKAYHARNAEEPSQSAMAQQAREAAAGQVRQRAGFRMNATPLTTFHKSDE